MSSIAAFFVRKNEHASYRTPLVSSLRAVRNNKSACRALLLFLLLVDAVGLGDRVELFGFVLLTWVLLVLVVEAGVVGMAFPNAIFVAH